MNIIEFFTSDNKEHWISEIDKSDWGAGHYLADLLRKNQLKDLVGETTLVLMLVDGEKLVSYCTFAPLDEIQPTELTPWIGFAYTFPEYRGQRYLGQILDYAECISTIMGKDAIYISTDHVGLYEKYGYKFFRKEQTVNNEISRVYRKILNEEGSKKNERMEKGNVYKADIVAAARKNIDPVAYCGFSVLGISARI